MEDQDLPGGVDLGDAINALRSQLAETMETTSEHGLHFKPGSVELTVSAAVTKKGGGKLGIKWLLIDAGADLSRQSVVTQTLKITLAPVLIDKDGQPKDVLISGNEDSSEAVAETFSRHGASE